MLRGFWIAGVSLLLVIGAVLVGSGRERSVRQPIQFNHAKHKAAGLECSFCHQGVDGQAFAGLPPLETCAICHTAPMTESTEEAKLATLIVKGEPVPWQRLYGLAPHVFFSHRRHLQLAQLECKTCHGPIEDATTPPVRPAVKHSMKWCMSCHEQRGASLDCMACHR